MNEKLTLRELLSIIPVASESRVPGKSILRESSQPVAIYESTDYRITVFASGYALAEDGKRWTVFSVAICGPYQYDPNELEYSKDCDFQHMFDSEYFIDLPWPIRVSMQAEDRLESNNDEEFIRLLSKHPGYIENIPWLRGWEASAEDVVLEKITMDERLTTLTPKQRHAVEMWVDGHSGKEIAEECGVTQQAISERLYEAFIKLNKEIII